MKKYVLSILSLVMLGGYLFSQKRQTQLSIVADQFYLNGRPTFEGRIYNGYKVEGLLPNSRMVQGIFDDLNPETRRRWAYADTQNWDPDRNTREFTAAMDEWRRHGLLAVTLNLQGGSPEGYSQSQPWINSAFTAKGKLRKDYMKRLEQILDKADELGMAVIVGYFYFGQDQRLEDEQAVLRAVDRSTRWILKKGYENVLVEINNECNIQYDHEILKPNRVHELILRVKNTNLKGRRLAVSTSYGGGTIPGELVAKEADYLLLHGNGVHEPERIVKMVEQTRALKNYRPMPIVFNEDDHFNFDQTQNNFIAALSAYASWGYFDYRMKGEGYNEGYQSVPVNWGISSNRKWAFFKKLKEVTGL